MAWVPYNTAKENQWDGNAINLDGGGATIKLDLVTASYTPNIDTDEVRSATNEVAPGTSYTAGGPTVQNQLVTLDTVNDEVEWDFDDLTFAQDATGFTDARYARAYVNAGNFICYADLGGNKSVQTGALTLQMNANGVLRQ